MYTSLSNFLYIQEYNSKITLKVSKFQKKIFLFSFEPKNKRNYFLNSALASKMSQIKQERKGFRSMIASSQFSNLQLGNLAIWQLGNLARNAELTFNFGNFQFLQLSIFATFNFCNFQFLQLSILTTFNFGNFQFLQLSTFATFNFGNFQFWQLSILATFNFGNFQFNSSKMILFGFWFKWEQENLLLKFTDLYCLA